MKRVKTLLNGMSVIFLAVACAAGCSFGGSVCEDADGDGYGEGSVCRGPDCNDGDAQCWVGAGCSPGSATCGEVWACVQGCGGGGACENSCISYGDGQAQGYFDDLEQCILYQGCQGDPSCIQLLCGPSSYGFSLIFSFASLISPLLCFL